MVPRNRRIAAENSLLLRSLANIPRRPNHIEGNAFYDFHVHMATERYQDLGTREDAYAEPKDRYADFHGALQCLLQDTNLILPPDPQGTLFGED